MVTFFADEGEWKKENGLGETFEGVGFEDCTGGDVEGVDAVFDGGFEPGVLADGAVGQVAGLVGEDERARLRVDQAAVGSDQQKWIPLQCGEGIEAATVGVGVLDLADERNGTLLVIFVFADDGNFAHDAGVCLGG